MTSQTVTLGANPRRAAKMDPAKPMLKLGLDVRLDFLTGVA